VTTAGSGTLVLTGANTYTGATTVSAGTLQLGSGSTDGSLATTSAVVNNGVLAFNRSNAVVQGTDFNAVISGTGEVRQIGAGTTTLNGTNTYTGATSITAGTLSISAEENLGANPVGFNAGQLTINGGTLSTTANVTLNDINRGITIGLAGGTIDTVATSTALTADNAITFTGDLTKTGAGTLFINSDSNSGTGTTTVLAGTLGGNGTITGDTTIGAAATITAGTIGNSPMDVGTLTFYGDLNTAGGTWLIDLVQGGSADNITVTSGALNIAGANLAPINFSGTFTGFASYEIATYATGQLSGTFAGLADGAFVDPGQLYYINYGTNAITLTAVPEPGTLGLLGLALAGFFTRRTRRIRRRRVEAAMVQSAEAGE